MNVDFTVSLKLMSHSLGARVTIVGLRYYTIIHGAAAVGHASNQPLPINLMTFFPVATAYIFSLISFMAVPIVLPSI